MALVRLVPTGDIRPMLASGSFKPRKTLLSMADGVAEVLL